MMKIAIIGASGFVGSYLYDYFKKNHDVVGTYQNNKENDLEKLDMKRTYEVDKFFQKYKPEVVLFPAAAANVDWCETNVAEAYKINVEGTRNVVLAAEKYKAKMVYFSTDYVFDGKAGPYDEDAEPNPMNFYGLTKLLSENVVQQTLQNYLIVRITWVYGWEKTSKNFADSTIKLLRKGGTRKVATDQYATPTYVESICEGVEKLLDKDLVGVYNLVGSDYVSRQEFAFQITDKFNLNKNLIVPVETEKIFQIAKRPLNGGLLIDKIVKDAGFNPVSIDSALNRMKEMEQKNATQ